MISRDEAVGLLEQQHDAVAELFAELDADAFTRRGTMGGSGWSAKDLAAHLGSWEEFSLETMDAFDGAGATDRINEREMQRFLDTDPAHVLTRFEDLHRRLVGAIRRMSDEAWASEYPFYAEADTLGERVGGLLGSDDGDFMHASAHLPDLRAYVDSISP